MHIKINDGTLWLEQVEVAATLTRRLKGLLGRDGLPATTGMLIVPCSSIHTFFMRFPIDVFFLAPESGEPLNHTGCLLPRTGSKLRVVSARYNLPPWRMAWPLSMSVSAVLETAPGNNHVRQGDILAFEND